MDDNGPRRVTLTFDNGPTPGVTGSVLDVLAAEDVPATFFVVGTRLRAPGGLQLARRARAEGHAIGHHTTSHSMLLGAAPDPVAAVQAEIEDLAPDMREFDGPDRLFRPYAAGGILDAQVLSRAAIDHLERQGYTCVLWNCVPHDWDDPDGWVDTALSEIQSRSWTVVVLHDVDTGAMAHLGRFIGQVRQTGGELVGDFPPDCVPIVGGRTVLPISHLTPRSAQPSTHPAPTKEAAS